MKDDVLLLPLSSSMFSSLVDMLLMKVFEWQEEGGSTLLLEEFLFDLGKWDYCGEVCMES
jgi:hypothetical protein